MKKVASCLAILLLCTTAMPSQTKHASHPANSGLAPGYYFAIDMCRACYYPEWKKDAIRLFKLNALRATVNDSPEFNTSSQSFAPVRLPKRGLYGEVVYVGPFETEAAAMSALEKFPPVLSFIQNKRSKMGGPEDSGWPLSDGEKVSRTSGNDYQYGFYSIKGYKLVS
jgi:hypothetical protein